MELHQIYLTMFFDIGRKNHSASFPLGILCIMILLFFEELGNDTPWHINSIMSGKGPFQHLTKGKMYRTTMNDHITELHRKVLVNLIRSVIINNDVKSLSMRHVRRCAISIASPIWRSMMDYYLLLWVRKKIFCNSIMASTYECYVVKLRNICQ